MAGQDLAVDGLVAGQVVRGEQAAVGVNGLRQLVSHLALIELIRVGDDALKRLGEVGLPEGFALLIEVSIALKDALRLRELRQIAAMKGAGLPGGKDEALLREPDGGGHVFCEGKFAESLLGVDKALHRAGDADGLVAKGRKPRNRVAGGVEIHIGRSCSGGALAEVEEIGGGGGLSVASAVTSPVLGHADQHEASAAQVSGTRIGDGQREADGNCRVDGVAALLEDGEAGVRGVVLHADDHGMAARLDSLLGRKGETRQQSQGGQGTERHRGRTSVPVAYVSRGLAARAHRHARSVYFTVTVSE